MQKETIAKPPSGRTRRTPVGTRNVLTVREEDKDPNFEYRFVNDDGDKVQRYLDAGYEIDDSGVRIGDKRVGSATPEGTKAQVSVGQGMKAFLMKIKKEWYKEDQDAKQAKIEAVEAQTKQKALDGTYGKLSINE